MKIFGSYVMVNPSVAEKTMQGLSMPESKQKRDQIGTIVDAGDGCTRKYVAGQKIVYEADMVVELHINGEKKYLVNEEDIFGEL
jgi:co-chaperonin GroES (HSP10)